MARQLYNGNWNPVIWDEGYCHMVELIDGEWKFVECNTKEEAERKEREYRDFWNA